jgi:hypothetical protein
MGADRTAAGLTQLSRIGGAIDQALAGAPGRSAIACILGDRTTPRPKATKSPDVIVTSRRSDRRSVATHRGEDL